MKFSCPHCEEPSFSPGKKFLAGKWATLTCDRCGGRSCTNPILLAVLYFFLIWDVLLFGYLAYIEHQLGNSGMAALYLVVMVVGWLLLEALGLYLPLSRMRALPPDPDKTSDPEKK